MNIESPDLMTFAKQMSSAYFPISASLIRGDMYEAIASQSSKVGVFGHGYTYSGHPVGCAVALKTLEIHERDGIFTHAAEVGEYFQKRLREFAEHELLGDIRGIGLIAAVQLKSSDPSTVGALQQACQDHGLLGRAVAGTSLAFCPPLIISKRQIDELIEKLGLGLEQTLSEI